MLKKILKNTSYIIITFIFFTSLIILLLRWVNPPTTAFIQQLENDSYQSMFVEQEKLQEWVPIKSISKNILFAVIASEDQRFFDHFGFDFIEIGKAVEEKLDSGKIRGASTITQQVAKNLFLWPTKSIIRKGIELYYAILLELIWDKKRILEVYLNVAQFGDKIYGVEAASNYYFNKSSQFLNIDEAVQLISILPNPIKFDLQNKSSYLNSRIEKIKLEIKNIEKGKILEIV
ncbi:MAG: monofunctional biosynthetic peptidoglycan transglycosylase, partial [Melioribacteraceae bacterium]|nr:monofunctional biosynthetic peptidoglycan transglycosylase [Melioribacteraceae bacterium]